MLRQVAKKSTSRQQSCHKMLLRRLQSSVKNSRSSSTATAEASSAAVPRRTLSSLHAQNPHEGYAMKALMDTLQMALVSPHRPSSHGTSALPLFYENVTAAPQILLPPPDYMLHVHEDATAEAASTVVDGNEQQQEVTTHETHPAATKLPPAPIGRGSLGEDPVKTKAYIQKIQNNMNANDSLAVYTGIKEACADDNIRLHRKFLGNCFKFMTTRNPVFAHEILNHYHELYGADVHMYKRIAGSVSSLTAMHGSVRLTEAVVKNIYAESRERLTFKEQQIVLPVLLEATAMAKLISACSQSLSLYNTLVGNKPEENDGVNEEETLPIVGLTPDVLERLLGLSKYWSEVRLPYHDVLQKFAASGALPTKPQFFAGALSHMYPFTDTEKVLVAIDSIHQIVKNCQENENADPTSMIQIDIGTLESIMAGASRVGSYELGLATWDLYESLGYTPSEALYECMIQAFVMSYRQDQCAFACLADMEDQGGFTPTRSVVRSISRSLRFSANRVDHAYRLVMSQKVGCRPTLSSINAIMSACAELGDVERTFSVLLDDFPKKFFDAEPNQDSFSFAMESLSKSALTDQGARKENAEDFNLEEYDERRRSRLQAAELLLNMMEERGLAIDHHVFHEYILTLINSDEMEMAALATNDALDTGFKVENKTIMLLINNQLNELQDFDAARAMVARTTENFDFLIKRIQKREDELRNHEQQLASAAEWKAMQETLAVLESVPGVEVVANQVIDDVVDDDGTVVDQAIVTSAETEQVAVQTDEEVV